VTCDEVRPKLVALIHRELDSDELLRHVSDCADCFAVLQEHRRIHQALGDWAVAPGPDLWPRIRPARRLPWLAAAAALLVAVGTIMLWSKPPPVVEPLLGGDDVQIERHVRIASWKRDEVPPPIYPYRGSYDLALDGDGYTEYSCSLVAAYASEGPGYLPRGSILKSAGETQSVYWTPLGELSIFKSRARTGREGLQTVIRDGRELKIARFVDSGIEITLMSEGLPWPELDRIREGLVKERF
jgi:hypothetical protein